MTGAGKQVECVAGTDVKKTPRVFDSRLGARVEDSSVSRLAFSFFPDIDSIMRPSLQFQISSLLIWSPATDYGEAISRGLGFTRLHVVPAANFHSMSTTHPESRLTMNETSKNCETKTVCCGCVFALCRSLLRLRS